MNPKRQHRHNYNIPGHAHELTFSCYQGFEFLKADRTCRWLIDSLEAARSELDFAIWAYVFMPNHAHIVVYPRRKVYNIADIRTAIKEPVAREAIAFMAANAPEWLSRITRKRGARTERLFWQSGGGYDRNVDEPRTLSSMIEYIHLNPVRKRLVERAVDWKWSSAAWFHDAGPSPLRVDPIPPEWIV